MTTGRINQVTIVRRGWPPARASRAGEISKLLVGTYLRAGAPPSDSALGHGRGRRRWAIRFPPLRSPGHPSAARARCGQRVTWAPQEEDHRAASAIAASASAGLPPDAQW